MARRTARRAGPVLLAVVLLAACATAAPPRPRAAEAPPARCSPGDPDRQAWLCVIGRILYGAATFFSPVNELTMR